MGMVDQFVCAMYSRNIVAQANVPLAPAAPVTARRARIDTNKNGGIGPIPPSITCLEPSHQEERFDSRMIVSRARLKVA